MDSLPKPHIVWTLRRTGGTTLAALLESLSPHPTVEHEPFLSGRVFGDVGDAYESRHRDLYERRMRDVIQQGSPIKHCIDTRSMGFTLDLAAKLSGPYQHVLMLRRSEARRLLSLAVATETGAFGWRDEPDVRRPIRLDIRKFRREHWRCQKRVSKLRDLFDEHRVPYRLVYFEDFYTGERDQRIRNCLLLVDYLGLGPVPEGGLDLLFTREQSKASHEHIANREKFLAEVTRRPGVVARAVARAREAVGAA